MFTFKPTLHKTSSSSTGTATPSFRACTPRHYLMCPPDYFCVMYSINPWMDFNDPVDPKLAMQQWQKLQSLYEQLGHTVDLIEPQRDLPDMVFAANAATVIEGKILGARFRAKEREAEADLYRQWFDNSGYREFTTPMFINEAEGDFVWTGSILLAGMGFRTTLSAHAEAQEVLGIPVVSLELVDRRFYHLDTALFVLDDDPKHPLLAYYPAAFSPGSQRALKRLYPDAILASDEDAMALGLNGVSDGRHVVLTRGATRLGQELQQRGFEVFYVDMSEFMKSGGGPKCCTMELRGLKKSGMPIN